MTTDNLIARESEQEEKAITGSVPLPCVPINVQKDNRSINLRMKFWCLQIFQKANQILVRFLTYEARAKISVNHLVGFEGDLKTPKFHSEIN